jgi:hypothetical protein
MNPQGTVNVPRLIRIATLSFALLGGALVYFTFAPAVDGLQQRIDDAQETLRSGDVAFSEISHVRTERDELARRYARLFSQNPEAVFLRELSATVRARRVTLLSTSVSRDPSGVRAEATHGALLAPTLLQIELRGRYAPVLAAIGDLSLGSEIVDVQAPSLRRDGDAVIASIPVTIYEPGAQSVSASAAAWSRK